MLRRRPVRLVVLAGGLLATALVLGRLAAQPDEPAASWSQLDRLIRDQRFAAAAEMVRTLGEAAREDGDEAAYTRALIRETQLRMGLHGVETAVRDLRAAAWPDGPRYRLVVELYYAHSLVHYVRLYDWEIRQRERVASDGEVDLRAWTLEQIVAEAHAAYGRAWTARDSWGDASLGELAEHFETNNYPPHVRGTLRDTVAYLWAELLADSGLWRPDHAAEVWRLDLAALIDGAAVALDDSEIHPLARLAAVLGDLETWHRQGNRPEASFEARHARLGHLWNHATVDDRELLIDDLGARLAELGSAFPWWAMGRATLAEWVRQGERPDHLIEARRLALEGAELHPRSHGGRACRSVVEQIEQPQYELDGMLADGPGRRSLRLQHKNLGSVHFRAWRLDPDALLADDPNAFLPQYHEVPTHLEGPPAAAWSVELPATPDYELHSTYVTPPLEQPGVYLVAASARRDFARDRNRRAALPFVLGDLVLRRATDDPEWTVLSGATGAPLAGARVSLWSLEWQRPARRLGELVTGGDGVARFELPEGGRFLALARRGDEVALEAPAYLVKPQGDRAQRQALVYTDRAVYRPRQRVHWKAVAFSGQGGDFEVLPGTAFTVSLHDANGDAVEEAEVRSNAFGTASGTFDVPIGRLLGGWWIRTSFGSRTPVRIEEYRRPTFEVEMLDPETEMRLNRPITLTGEARYYFGLPVVGGEVVWRVRREPVWLPWIWRGPWMPTEAPRLIAHGTSSLDAEGRFTVPFTPEADERLADQPGLSYRYRVDADVTDEGGETRSGSRSFRLGFVAVEAGFGELPGFLRAGEARQVVVERRALDGQGRAGAGSWTLRALATPDAAVLPADLPADPPGVLHPTPGDLLRPRGQGGYQPELVLRDWDDGAEMASGELRHADDGTARLTLPPLPAGAYRLRYTTGDAFGARFETARELVVAGEGGALPLAGFLEVEEEVRAVGEPARVLLHSGFADQQMLLLIERRDGVESRAFTAGASPRAVEIPVGRGDRGGFGVRLLLVRDHQVVSLARRIAVPWDDRRLELDFTTFRDALRPGETETWTVEVRGADAAVLDAGAAELLAYMYDRSLDLFAPHRPPDPLHSYPSFYPPFEPVTTLGWTGSVWSDDRRFAPVTPPPVLAGDRLKSYESYGIGGPGLRRRFGMAVMKMDAMAVAEESVVSDSMRVASDDEPAPQAAPPPPPQPSSRPIVEPEAPIAAEPLQLRSDYSETAFWEPHLVLGENGSVSFTFTVPESLTAWSVWVHALTRDLRGGHLERRVETSKELMVRPYLPRFLRQGDRAEIRILVQNASDRELAGELDFDIRDPETDESLLASFGVEAADRSFRVEPRGSDELAVPIVAPRRLGEVAFRVVGRAEGWSDGELRPLPVLPSRLHLAQSRFAALNGEDRRVLEFTDLARADDPTREHERLVVNLDAQLFFGVLRALPYLVDSPYACTEQILNRFVSTGIVSRVFADHPAIARMAESFAGREARLETWAFDDPNRTMALEETPWLVAARGGDGKDGEDGEELIRVLDPEIAAAQRELALAQLREAQLRDGGFPWFPGGPASPYMTLYLVDGLSRALEAGVEVPRDLVVGAWGYLSDYWQRHLERRLTDSQCCLEMVTYLNFLLSAYPDTSWTGEVFTDDDRARMLEYSFKYWRDHSPRLKGMLALTLSRAGREGDARRVFDSVMDSARTTRDEGTFWAPEERSWLWYNDTVESHAFALRVLSELAPDDARRHGLVQWLFLNKQLNHWKSTRATAEAIYSLVHYLDHEDELATRENATVQVGPRTETFLFDPERYTNDSRVILDGQDVEASMSRITVSKTSPGFLFASATWHFSTEALPEEARGDFFSVTRRFFRRSAQGTEWVLRPLADGEEIAVGDQIEVQLSLRAKHAAEYVHLRDPRGAGFEPESLTSGYRWDLGPGYYEEVRDSGANYFFDWLPAGEHTFKHRLRASTSGVFRVGPATVQSMYAPEFVAYSSGATLTVR